MADKLKKYANQIWVITINLTLILGSLIIRYLLKNKKTCISKMNKLCLMF